MNKVILIGNLTRDPENRATNTGKTVASFGLAVQRRYRPQSEGGSDVDFINCVAWDSTAAFITKYFQKGSKIGIVGRISTRQYEDKTGQKRTAFEVVVESAEFVTSKAQNPASQREYSNQEPAYDEAPMGDASFEEDLLEFEPLEDDKLPF